MTTAKPVHFDIKWLNTANLCVVWASAQRAMDENHAKRIANEFDPDMLDPIKVTMPNGEGIYHVVDGQHRVAAIRVLWGNTQSVPCIVLPEMEPARAAKVWLNINTTGRKRPQPIDVFKVAVTAERPQEVAISNLLSRLGFKVGPNKERSGPSKNYISCVGALKWAESRFGIKTLEDALKILQATWNGDPNAFEGNLVKGYVAFLGEFPGANWQKTIEVMQKKRHTPGRVLGQAKSYREVHGGNTAEAVKQFLVGGYNRRVPPARRLKQG